MSFGDDTLDPSNLDLRREQQSHDAELNRIAQALHIPVPATVEDIIKAIKHIEDIVK